jgi:hypothetical protein
LFIDYGLPNSKYRNFSHECLTMVDFQNCTRTCYQELSNDSGTKNDPNPFLR